MGAVRADRGRPRFLLGPRRKFLVRGGASHVRKRDHARLGGSGRGLGRHQGPESKTGSPGVGLRALFHIGVGVVFRSFGLNP